MHLSSVNVIGTGRYQIPRHVHLCRVPGGVVFLDLKRNRYFSIGGPHAQELSALVVGWPTQASADGPCTSCSSAIADRLAAALVQHGLLTADDISENGVRMVRTDPIHHGLAIAMIAPRARISFRRAIRFLFACLWAAAVLRWTSLDAVIHKIARMQGIQHATTSSLSEVAELSEVFQRLFALLFSAKNRCLFCSLAMFKFLSAYGIHPVLVIGVKTHPFAAHSWIQYRDVVLSELWEQASHYTPILAI